MRARRPNRPKRKVLFLPLISANLPNGIRRAVEARRNPFTTQPIVIASAPISLPIDGRATLRAEELKVVTKEAMLTAREATALSPRPPPRLG